MTDSIPPRSNPTPPSRFQPSVLSLRGSAATVAPEDQAPNSTPRSPKPPQRRKLWFFAALSALAVVGAAAALRDEPRVASQVRSGSPGYRKSSTGRDLHWAKKGLTVHLDDSLAKLGQGADEAVMQAFGSWVASDRRLPSLSFDTVKGAAQPQHDGKSVISYGPIKAPGHERDVAITVTYSNDKSGEIIEADIILNSLYPMGVLTATIKNPSSATNEKDPDGDGKGKHDGNWGSKSLHDDESSDCGNRYDAQNVATHEAGHFFGLGEDMTDRASAMFLSIDQCETHKRALGSSDVGAVTQLYAENEDPEEAKAGARGCSVVRPVGSASTSGALLGFSGLIVGLGLLGRRRAR